MKLWILNTCVNDSRIKPFYMVKDYDIIEFGPYTLTLGDFNEIYPGIYEFIPSTAYSKVLITDLSLVVIK